MLIPGNIYANQNRKPAACFIRVQKNNNVLKQYCIYFRKKILVNYSIMSSKQSLKCYFLQFDAENILFHKQKEKLSKKLGDFKYAEKTQSQKEAHGATYAGD